MRRRAMTVALMLLCVGAAPSPAVAAGAKPEAQAPKKPVATESYRRGEAAEKKGNYQQAATEYRQAVVQDPAYAEAHNQLGYVYRRLRKYDQAIASYTAALKLRPKFAEAHDYIARAYLAKGDLAKAKEHHAQLAALNSKLAAGLATAIARHAAKPATTP